MSTDIAGWVEIKRNDIWFGIVRLLPIMRRNYKMFDFLFGGRSDNYDDAIAGNRGTPDDLSDDAKPYCETWIMWSEIQAIDWSKHEDIMSDDWRDLFKIMKILAENGFSHDVRLVVYFF
jgi:hypothetical protein